MKKTTKQIKLRAFCVKCYDMNKKPADFVPELAKWLNSTTSEERMLSLSPGSVDTEKDLCCHFTERKLDSEVEIFGTMVRLKGSSDLKDVPDSLLKKRSFALSELNSLKDSSHKIINHFYYLLKNNYLICNIPGNQTIKRFETYINWALKKDMYSFIPVVVSPPEMKLSQLKRITFEDPFASKREGEITKKKAIILKESSLEVISKLFKDTPTLQEIELDKILTAQLILNFRKPRSMSDEDCQNSYGALLKSVSDLENVKFRDNNDNVIKGTDIECAKNVNIELIESGAISEPELQLEMSRFIHELPQQ